MNDKIIQLIIKLLRNTEKNELVWEKTSRDTEFRINFHNGAVSTDKWFDPENFNESIDFKVYNINGDEISGWSYNWNDEDAKILKNLYETILGKYLKVDETLDGILYELDNEIP